MTFTAQNTDCRTGEDIQIPFVIVDEFGKPRDISSATFTYSVRDKPGGTLLFAVKTLGSGITVDSGIAGTGHINVASADTASAVIVGAKQDFYHALEMIISSSHDKPWEGRFRLWKSVSGAGA